MAINVKSNPDGNSGAIQVNGVDAVSVSNTGVGVTGTLSVSGTSTVGSMSATNVTASAIIANTVYAQTIASVSSFSWNSATATPAASSSNPYGSATPVVTSLHRKMRRCVVTDAGAVAYYLDPSDSTKKEDGSSAILTGADGQVMVEIPMFYAKREKVGTVTTWSVSDVPLSGFELHPAFVRDGAVVPFRYIGAYDACYFEASSGLYKSGLNLDALTVNTGADKLASVSGVYPIVGVTRATVRSLAANRGTGWRLADFWLIQAIQMLYLVEHQTFYSQSVLGAGNTNSNYDIASSSNQSDSPHTVAGASNGWGNSSTNGTQPSAGAKPGTAYMSYRGIENLFGNTWTWIDGFNINNNQAYVSNNRTNFADDTLTNYQALGAAMPATNGYPVNHQDIDHAWLPSAVGGSTTTYWTDYYWQASGWRVAFFGGNANSGGNAGAFCWALLDASAARSRTVGARLAR